MGLVEGARSPTHAHCNPPFAAPMLQWRWSRCVRGVVILGARSRTNPNSWSSRWLRRELPPCRRGFLRPSHTTDRCGQETIGRSSVRRTWLFKLVPKVTALQALGSPKIGMSLAIVASEFLLHINHAGGPVGAKPEFATHRSPIEALLLVGPRSGNCKMGH